MGGTTYSHGDHTIFNHISPVFAPVEEPVHTPISAPVSSPLPLTPPFSRGNFPHPPVSDSLAQGPHHISPIRFLHDPVTVRNKPHHVHHHVHPHVSESVAPLSPPVASPLHLTTPISRGYFPHPPVSESLAPSPQPISPIRYLNDPVPVSTPHHFPQLSHHVPHHQVVDQQAPPHLPHVHAPFPINVPTPVHHVPQQNCSLVSEMATAEVCTPSLQTTCTTMELAVKNIVDKEECRRITRTVCSIIEQENDHEICVYKYQEKSEEASATNYEIIFQKECQLQMKTVCQSSAGAGYTKIEDQYCKEEEQENCYKVPMVMPKQETVTVTYPEPIMECLQKPITIPQVTCQDVNEEKCFIAPKIMDDIILVEKCEVSLGAPSCQVLERILPKQVCTELVFVESGIKREMDVNKETLEVQRTKLESMMKIREQRKMKETAALKKLKKALKEERTKQESMMKMKEQPKMMETLEFDQMKKAMEEERTMQERMMKMKKMHGMMETSELEQMKQMNELENTIKTGELDSMMNTSELKEMMIINEMA